MSDRQRRARRVRRRRHQALGTGAGTAAVAALLISSSVAHAAGPVSVVVDSSSGSPTGTATVQAAGSESLADAIAYVDANSAGGAITFASSLQGATITLTGGLPQITVPTTITGLGQKELSVSGGGASLTMFDSSASLSVSGLTLENIAKVGSAATAFITSSGPLTVSESTLTGIHGTGSAYGILGAGSVTLSSDTLTADTSSRPVVKQTGSQPMTVSGSTISDDTDELSGVLVSYSSGALTVSDSVFDDDSSDDGGAILADAPTTITGSQFTGDSTDNYGGAILAYGSALTVTDSTLSGNTSGLGGGAIATFGYLTTLTNSTLDGNVVTGDPDPTPTTQRTAGGAFFSLYDGSLLAVGDTIDGNRVTGGAGGAQGGGIALSVYDGTHQPSGSVTLEDTVVAQNTVSDASAPQLAVGPDVYLASGASGSARFSLIGAAASAADTGVAMTLDGTDQVGSVASPLNPGLGALADNGGTVQTPAGDLETQLPGASSPLINTGDAGDFTSATTPFTTDELGAPRPSGSAAVSGGDGADIGAVELQPAAVTTTPTSPPTSSTTSTPTPTPTPTTSAPSTTTPVQTTTTPVAVKPKPKLDHASGTVGNQAVSLTWVAGQSSSTFAFSYRVAAITHSRRTKAKLRAVEFFFDSSKKPVKPKSDRHGSVVLNLRGLKRGTQRLHVRYVFSETVRHKTKLIDKTFTIAVAVR